MKKTLVLLILAVTLFTALVFASDFCDGYQAGYKEGYCYQKFACIPPIPPLCPIPRIGEDTYQDGYNRSFIAGLNARR